MGPDAEETRGRRNGMGPESEMQAASTIGQRLHDMQMQVLFTENSNSFACLAWEHGSN
jgi:hypothetical protein